MIRKEERERRENRFVDMTMSAVFQWQTRETMPVLGAQL